MNQENVHLWRGAKSSIAFCLLAQYEVVDANDSCMPVQKCCVAIRFIFMGQDYYVHVHMGFGELFYPVYIICCGPELDGLVILWSYIQLFMMMILLCSWFENKCSPPLYDCPLMCKYRWSIRQVWKSCKKHLCQPTIVRGAHSHKGQDLPGFQPTSQWGLLQSPP